MRKYTYLLVVSMMGLFLSCDDQDDPIPVNEEELITTVRLVLTPQGGGTAINLESKDLDGTGPDVPVVTVSGPLAVNETYNGELELLNETETPAEIITEEVKTEGADHQFFFQLTQDIATISYDDVDTNGDPIGLSITVETTAVGNADLTVILRHEPEKSAAGVSDGDISLAGGETDVQVIFPIKVE